MVRKYLLHIALCVGAAASSFGTSSCINDPVHNSAVNALGDETPGYPEESQYHRPGQPCTTCHWTQGPGSNKFVLAGTVFWGQCNISDQEAQNPAIVKARCDRQPVDRAEVRVLASKGGAKCFYTNCAGNFFVREDEWNGLTYPLLVSVSKKLSNGTYKVAKMSGHIGREPSCANCHDNPARAVSPGQVYLYEYNEKGELALPAEAKALKCPPEAPNTDPPKECEL
jgi:hypothetical protein